MNHHWANSKAFISSTICFQVIWMCYQETYLWLTTTRWQLWWLGSNKNPKIYDAAFAPILTKEIKGVVKKLNFQILFSQYINFVSSYFLFEETEILHIWKFESSGFQPLIPILIQLLSSIFFSIQNMIVILSLSWMICYCMRL